MTIFALIMAALWAAPPSTPLDTARDQQDRAALQKIIGEGTAAAAKAPNDAEAQYRVALASSYFAEVAIEQRDRKLGRQVAEQGIKAAEKAVSLKPGNAEYYRVLGTLYGQAVTDILSGLSYGAKAKQAINTAVEKAPNSATVYVARGVGNYYLPAQVGGGTALAIADFRKAIALDPNNAEAWMWLGLGLRKENQDAEARKAFGRSLQLNPNRVWAKQQLEEDPGEMKRLGIAAASGAIALLTFWQFPGRTYLQQDSQIYVPILEYLRDTAVLRNEILVQHSHVAYTLYDEAALALRGLTGLGFREVLAFEQLVTRALGIWGLYLIARSLGLAMAPALLVALIVSLGALVPGPQVLTVEYEPTPRAFAVPLLFCAMGLAAQRRYQAAAIPAAVAFLYHFPAALPFWLLFGVILILRRNYRPLAPLAVAAAVLVIAARAQGGSTGSLNSLTLLEERLQHMRTAYVWISTWPFTRIVHHLLVAAIAGAAYLRIRRVVPFELHVLLPGVVILGLLSMPLSWLLLEHWKLSLAPQVQPMRALLFVTLAMQLLTAAAGVEAAHRGRRWEAAAWFVLAYLPPLQTVFTEAFTWRRTVLALVLAGGTALTGRFAPAVALAAFFLIPTAGGIVNYPQLRTAELGELAGWARSDTPPDGVFLFADAGRALEPGIFRSEALRAVYVDWKGGGQVNYLREFAEQWWFRWQQTLAREFKPDDLARYDALGVQYVVLQPKNRLAQPPVFENARYLAYRTGRAQ